MQDRVKTGRRAMLAAIAALAGLGLGGAGRAYVPSSEPVTLTVVDRQTGQVLRLYPHQGRLYVAGRPGARYALRVSNHTSGRVLVVLSVDGVNILTGETAGYDQRGYIFGPGETYDVAGWRKSDRQIAAFTFAPQSQSYAARTGRPNEVGVIGMAVFNERVAYERPYEDWRGGADDSSRDRNGYDGPASAPPPAARAAPSTESRNSASGGLAARRDEKLGTGHGRREWSVVTTVPFERATDWPTATRQIEYDTYAHLVAAGVIAAPYYGDRHPQPFPSGGGYVPDPPGF